jgi:hypothetical protein
MDSDLGILSSVFGISVFGFRDLSFGSTCSGLQVSSWDYLGVLDVGFGV